jgi:hypothetical protein
MNEPQEFSRKGFFAVMWNCEGLEAVAELPDPADTTFALLQGTDPPVGPNLNHWRLRAQFNTQRHYEIYTITAEPGITAQDIRDMFAGSPQTAADTIRRIGQKLYSDRQTQKTAIL